MQSLVGTHEIGRVVALSRTVGVLAIPVGAPLAGALAQAWRIVPTLVPFAMVAVAGTVAVVARRDTYRTVPAPVDQSGAPVGH